MANVRRALVTGANGFVGQALHHYLTSRDWQVRRAVRSEAAADAIAVGDMGPDADWRGALEGVDCIVHLAARTHIVNDHSPEAIDAYRHVNVAGTVNLAKAAARHGVRRLVFLSSIKVNGERTPDHPFTGDDTPKPSDAYGISKHEAEQALWQIATDTGLEVTVLRPPLVYGPGVKANFLRLMHVCARRIPLPLASIENHRSLIYLGNLVNAITACMENPAAAGKTFLVSDSESVATPELIRRISTALGVEPRLFPFPASLLGIGARLFGRVSEGERLMGSLQIDSSRIRAELGWQPPYMMTQGLTETAQWYHSQFPLKSNT
jgi:nucleoside-diphosphate-sugar epimerase